jgi:hypothetical protein
VIKDPKDFTSALKGGIWNPDIILRLYRGLNPLISRSEALSRFKALKLTKDNPRLHDLSQVHQYPTNFSTAVSAVGVWDWREIYRLYAALGVTDQGLVKAHFKTLRVTTRKPNLNSYEIPAKYFHPLATGTVAIPWEQYPSNMPPDIMSRASLESPPWFDYLVEQLGYREAYLRVAYNLKEYYVR